MRREGGSYCSSRREGEGLVGQSRAGRRECNRFFSGDGGAAFWYRRAVHLFASGVPQRKGDAGRGGGWRVVRASVCRDSDTKTRFVLIHMFPHQAADAEEMGC